LKLNFKTPSVVESYANWCYIKVSRKAHKQWKSEQTFCSRFDRSW